MAERKAMSKKLRFEVFKRDQFTCQYCGAHPPAVILHVDHVHPVAAGGENEMDNLVTACEPCNAGKGARLLSSVPASLEEKANLIAEREEQLRGYQKILNNKAKRLNKEAQQVNAIYETYHPGYTLNDVALVSVRKFVDALGVHEVAEAMEIACSGNVESHMHFKYFCGVCWRKIKGN